MFSLSNGFDIPISSVQQNRAGLVCNLSVAGYVDVTLAAVIGADGFIKLVTQNVDYTQASVDYTSVRPITELDWFRFYEKQDASVQSDIWVRWSQLFLAPNYSITAYSDNYANWPQNTWARLRARHASNPTGIAINVYADSYLGAADFSLQFGRGASAAEAAISPTPAYPFRVHGYAA